MGGDLKHVPLSIEKADENLGQKIENQKQYTLPLVIVEIGDIKKMLWPGNSHSF